MREVWREIPGYPNYQASNTGLVRRSRWGKGTNAGHILKPWGKDYLEVGLWHDGVGTNMYVHVAVLLAFVGPKPSPEMEAAHWDGNKKNNTSKNLRWATRTENKEDNIRLGAVPKGSSHWQAKVSERQVLRMRKLRATGMSLEKLAAMFGITFTNVSFICRGEAWVHVGGPITRDMRARDKRSV